MRLLLALLILMILGSDATAGPIMRAARAHHADRVSGRLHAREARRVGLFGGGCATASMGTTVNTVSTSTFKTTATSSTTFPAPRVTVVPMPVPPVGVVVPRK